jgi:hypothetical protein
MEVLDNIVFPKSYDGNNNKNIKTNKRIIIILSGGYQNGSEEERYAQSVFRLQRSEFFLSI